MKLHKLFEKQIEAIKLENFIEIESSRLMTNKKHPVTKAEAKSIVIHRLCGIEISFLPESEKWNLNVYYRGHLVASKQASYQNKLGITGDVWDFAFERYDIPWKSIKEGSPFRCFPVILTDRFWRVWNLTKLNSIRDLLNTPALNDLSH